MWSRNCYPKSIVRHDNNQSHKAPTGEYLLRYAFPEGMDWSAHHIVDTLGILCQSRDHVHSPHGDFFLGLIWISLDM